MTATRHAHHTLAAVAALTALLACGDASSGAASEVVVDVRPATVEVAPGGSILFSALTTGTADTGVDWTVLDGPGGGTIDASGTYTAPGTTGTYTVVATSRADRSTSGTGKVVVGTTATVTGGAMPDCATTSLRSTGTIRYFCSNGGSDSNDGLSASKPKASWSAITSALGSMAAGDTVALCRGGSWTSSGTVNVNKRCSSGAGTCDIRDYGSGAKPIVNCSSSGGQCFYVNGASWVRFWNLDIRQTSSTSDTFMLTGDSRNLDWCGITTTGGGYTFDSQPSGRDNLNIRIRNNSISNTNYGAFFGGGADLQIINNVMAQNGGNSFYHTIYLCMHTQGNGVEQAQPWDGNPGTAPVVVANNDITPHTNCADSVIVIHGDWRNSAFVIDNNNIRSTSCFGIQASPGLSGGHFAGGAIIRRNRVASSANGIQLQCCSPGSTYGCVVSDNIITNNGSITVGDTYNTYGNLCSPIAGNMSANNLVENNSIYATGSPFASGLGIRMAGGTGHTLASNAIWQGGGSSCWSTTGTSADAGNVCRTSGVAATSWWADASGGDFTPVSGGPLMGTGSSTYFSPTAIGTASWSAADTGVARASPITAGALQ